MGIFSRRDKEGYDRDGYDKDGYDRDGYDKDGYDRDGYDKDGTITISAIQHFIAQFEISSKFMDVLNTYHSDFDATITFSYNEPTKIKSKSFFSHEKMTGIYSKTFESFSKNNVAKCHIEKSGKQYDTTWNKPKDTGRLQGDNFESGYTLIVTFNKNDHELKKILIDKLSLMNFGCLTSEYTLNCHLNEEYPNDERAKELLERVVKLFQSQNIESGV